MDIVAKPGGCWGAEVQERIAEVSTRGADQ